MKKENKAVPPILLTSDRFWYEIDELEKMGAMPAELGTMLKTLIITFFKKSRNAGGEASPA